MVTACACVGSIPTPINLRIFMLIDYFIEIFSATAIQFVDWIPGIVCLWVVFDLISGLIFKDR